MEREHYRRVADNAVQPYTPRAQRGEDGPPPERPPARATSPGKKAGRWEKFLARCIICGVALAVLLIVSLINTPFTNSLRTGLRSAIGDQTTVSQVESAYAAVENKVSSLFGGAPAPTDTPTGAGAVSATQTPAPAADSGVIAPSAEGQAADIANPAASADGDGGITTVPYGGGSAAVTDGSAAAADGSGSAAATDGSGSAAAADGAQPGVTNPAQDIGPGTAGSDSRIDPDVLSELNAS